MILVHVQDELCVSSLVLPVVWLVLNRPELCVSSCAMSCAVSWRQFDNAGCAGVFELTGGELRPSI